MYATPSQRLLNNFRGTSEYAVIWLGTYCICYVRTIACKARTNQSIEDYYTFFAFFAQKGCWARFDRPIRSLWLTIVINLMRTWVERIKKSQNVGLLSKKVIIVECTPGGRFRSIFRPAIFRFHISGPIFKYWMKTFDKMLLFQIIMQKYA